MHDHKSMSSGQKEKSGWVGTVEKSFSDKLILKMVPGSNPVSIWGC